MTDPTPAPETRTQKIEDELRKIGSGIGTGASFVWTLAHTYTTAAVGVVCFVLGFIVKWAWF